MSNSRYYWFCDYQKYPDIVWFGTEEGFGTGRSNTSKMVNYLYKSPVYENVWVEGSGSTEGYYEQQVTDWKYVDIWSTWDVWKQLKMSTRNGWFVPSRGEWSAFGANFEITKYNYNSTFGLNYYYLSSSQDSARTTNAWHACFYNGYMHHKSESCDLNDLNYVRLSTTF